MAKLPTLVLAMGLLLTLSSSGFSQMIVGHRGASFDAPENTIAAFNEAWRQGADGIEGDFYFTRDQHIVCIHDKDTQRTGGTKLDVASSTLAELQALEYGNWKDAKFAGEALPTFADVLQCLPRGKTFVIELKTGPDIVPLLKQQMVEYEVNLANVLIISFDDKTIAQCKKLLPAARAHWLTSYKQNPLTGAWRPTVDEIATTLRACKADGLGTKAERDVVTPAFIAQLKDKGLREFHVWTVDTPEDARYFQQLGAVGITTNRPAFIRQALTDRQVK